MLIEPDEPDSADKSVWDPFIDYRRRSSEDQGYYCYPFDMILLEGSKAMPIIRAIMSTQEHPIFIAINIYKEMSNSIAQLYASQIVPPSAKAKAVCINISKYDISEF